VGVGVSKQGIFGRYDPPSKIFFYFNLYYYYFRNKSDKTFFQIELFIVTLVHLTRLINESRQSNWRD
jgi:hypothetical protein